MLNPFQRLTSHRRQSASARPSHARHAATLGVERLELRSLLSASSLTAPNGDAWHFEEALYNRPAAVASQSQYGYAKDEASAWGAPLDYGYQQQGARGRQNAVISSLASDQSRRPAHAMANAHFVYIITFTWHAPLADSEPPRPSGFSEGLGDIVTLPKSSGSSRPLAAKVPPDFPTNSPILPASDLLGDVLDAVAQPNDSSAIAPFTTTTLAEPQTDAMRFSATLRAHDVVFQTLTNSAVAQRQDIETWVLASAEESRWARTDSEGEAETIANKDNADAQFKLSSLGTLRRVTDAQSDNLADLIDRLEQQAPGTWRRFAQGRVSAPAEGAVADATATTIGDAIQQADALEQVTIDEAGGMILLRATHGTHGASDVIDALDAALAIDDLDQFLSGKLAGSMPVTTAAAAEISTLRHDASAQTVTDSAASSSRSEAQPSTSSSILPIAAAGMGAMVIAARGGCLRDWLKMRRTTTTRATPK